MINEKEMNLLNLHNLPNQLNAPKLFQHNDKVRLLVPGLEDITHTIKGYRIFEEHVNLDDKQIFNIKAQFYLEDGKLYPVELLELVEEDVDTNVDDYMDYQEDEDELDKFGDDEEIVAKGEIGNFVGIGDGKLTKDSYIDFTSQELDTLGLNAQEIIDYCE